MKYRILYEFYEALFHIKNLKYSGNFKKPLYELFEYKMKKRKN